ncbi:hypothetical protein OEZ85_001114 [Tetradesmus obliquus]|uniref:Uncharacterized protein n=1 Tax=Tetradesmus obliquus TaxID=3088 RepID=A0ABY8UN81_TETOB|nr:hypothetical protein OEZ85_001114 [Tetradesmus obliquus]
MQWLVVERATALAAQEALLSKALGVPSLLEVAAASSSDSSSKDDISVIQQGLDMLHAYLHACSKAKLAGLEQLQMFVRQLEQDVQHSLQEMQQQEQQQQQQQQQQLAGLPEEGGVDDLLCEEEAQQQQRHGVSGAADSWQESSEARLQDSPFMRERLATTATAKQQAAASTGAAHANEDIIKKRLFFSKATSSGTTAAAAAAAAAASAGGDGCDAATGRMADQDSAVLVTPVLTCSSAKKSQQGLVARLLLRCFQPSSNSPRCKE